MTPSRPFLLVLLTLLLGSFPAGAGARPAAHVGSGPDVLILVAAMPHGQDQIAVTYAKIVPHAQALHDLEARKAATGWTLRHVGITDAASSLKRDRVMMTGIECVAANVVQPNTHGLPVKPFVQAFRNYPHVLLTYFVGQDFHFQGLHDYADDDVQIKLNQHGGAYTYQINIRNPRFERLDVPYLQPPPVSGVRAVRAVHDHSARAWVVALVAVAALGTACIVYALLSRAA